MAERILAAVGIQRGLIEATEQTSDLGRLIGKFATAQLYRRPATVEKLRQQIVKLLAKKYFPLAQEVGRTSAQPILDALGGRRLVDKGLSRRGPIFRQFQRYHRLNVKALAAQLRKECGTLSGEIEAAFARAQRDGIARKSLIDDLVKADKGELKRLRIVRREIRDASEGLKQATRKASTAGKRQRPKAKRALREAKKKLTKAKGKVGRAKTFYARFETRVQGHARDAIRREAQRAQFTAFKQAGYKTYTWIAVNGADACPDCKARHGKSYSRAEWQRQGMPGEGATVCGSSCMCQLVPKEYTEGNRSLTQPLNVDEPAPS